MMRCTTSRTPSLLVLGLARGDLSLVGRGLADRIHQPRRAHLYPRSMELVEQARRPRRDRRDDLRRGPDRAVLVPLAADRDRARGAAGGGAGLRRPSRAVRAGWRGRARPVVSDEVALACAGVVAGGFVQSASGFGFALVAAPALTATLGPVVAVPTIALLGAVVNALTLVGERHRSALLGRKAAVLIGASVPGMFVGALVLAHAPRDLLRALVAVVTLVSVAVYVRERRLGREGARRASGVAPAVLAGALGAASGINGPPLVAHLRRWGATPEQMRETLAAFFLVSGLLTLGAIALVGALELAPGLGWLFGAAVLGQLAGRLAFDRLSAYREAAVLATLALALGLAVIPAVQALA